MEFQYRCPHRRYGHRSWIRFLWTAFSGLLVFPEPFSFPENVQTLAGIAFYDPGTFQELVRQNYLPPPRSPNFGRSREGYGRYESFLCLPGFGYLP